MLSDLLDGLREAGRGWVEAFYAMQFGRSERIEFYESMIGVLEDGIPIDEALETVGNAYSEGGKALHPVSIICMEIAMSVRAGKKLSDACRVRFPHDETSLIDAGEETGGLVQAFRDCVRIIEARQRISRLVQTVVVLPTITWSLMWALLYVIAYWMVPSMSRRSDPESWTGVPAVLYSLSSFVTNWGFYAAAGVIGTIALSIFTLPYFCGLQVSTTSSHSKLLISRVLQSLRLKLEKFPPWSIYKIIHGSIFLLNMSVMLRAGINQLTALETLKKSSTPWLRERLDAIHYGVSSGKNFGDALKVAGHNFPDTMAIHFLSLLSTRKGFAESMERFANRWLDQMLQKVEAISKGLIAFSSICMGLLMILVVVGIFQIAGTAIETSGF